MGCDDEPELEDDPDLVVPGQTVPENPPMPAMGAAPPEMPTYDPALRVPGHDPLPDPPMPQMPGMPPGGMQPMGGPVPLAPGFQPQPIATQGVAGGPVDASTMGPGCVGWVSPQPSHVLQLSASFQNLRILVNSQTDTVLVVRAPNGTVRCNDDYRVNDPVGGFNPVVEGAFMPGPHQVFVGSYQNAITGPYVIGFTELPQIQTTQLVAPQAPPGGAPPPGGMQPMAPAQ